MEPHGSLGSPALPRCDAETRLGLNSAGSLPRPPDVPVTVEQADARKLRRTRELPLRNTARRRHETVKLEEHRGGDRRDDCSVPKGGVRRCQRELSLLVPFRQCRWSHSHPLSEQERWAAFDGIALTFALPESGRLPDDGRAEWCFAHLALGRERGARPWRSAEVGYSGDQQVGADRSGQDDHQDPPVSRHPVVELLGE
jgi:hypothetical protein